MITKNETEIWWRRYQLEVVNEMRAAFVEMADGRGFPRLNAMAVGTKEALDKLGFDRDFILNIDEDILVETNMTRFFQMVERDYNAFRLAKMAERLDLYSEMDIEQWTRESERDADMDRDLENW